MSKKEENAIVTGLENASDVKEAEYDLVASLLEAANYREDEGLITTVEIKRNGKFLFEVSIRPLGDEEVKVARKKATTYMPNPTNRKLPKIEKEFNTGLFNSLIIYAATTEEDKAKIWGNKAIMDKFNLVEAHEAVNVLLTVGEKTALADKVVEISGMDDEEEITTEEYVKN